MPIFPMKQPSSLRTASSLWWICKSLYFISQRDLDCVPCLTAITHPFAVEEVAKVLGK